MENRGEELLRLQKLIEQSAAELRNVGGKLSALRAKAAPALSADVRAQLRDLGFKKSEFEIRLAALAQPGAHGLESAEFVFAPRSSGLEAVEFLFAPNPGEPAKPLRSIASSGEISRVMLAVKSVLAKHDAVPLLVFDEIDANVGGEIAVKVGARMRELGRNHQVLCITHLPQVAAQAASHFVVEKQFDRGRTQSTLHEVKGTARRKEIARMLGGENDSSLALAKKMLGE
jgi:DNA repair protein RecN (Recombination protein N)